MRTIDEVENPVTNKNVMDAIHQLRELSLVAHLMRGLGDDNRAAGALGADEICELGKMVQRLVDHPLTVLNEIESHMPDR